MTEEERDAATAIINSDRFGKRFEDQLGYRENEPRMKRLKSGAWLMVGGLFHFLDLQIRALMRKGLDVRNLETVRVCFAGRGSTLLKLLRKDEAFDKLIVLPSVAGAAGEGRAGPNSVKAVFSEKPKHEAAQGMMAGEDARQTFELKVERVCGVGASIGETPIEPETVLDSGLTADPKERSSIRMGDFLAFLKRTGDTCGFSIALGSEASTDIRRSGEAELNAFLDGHRGDPPFITMLRRTLRLLYHGDDVELGWRDTQSRGPRGWFAATAIRSGPATPSASASGGATPARTGWFRGRPKADPKK